MDLSRKWKFIFAERARRYRTPHEISHWTKRGFEVRYKIIGKHLSDLYENNHTILDLGSGPGYYTELLSNPVLFDYTPAVFHAKSACTNNFNKNAKRVVGTLQNLPFKNNLFDGVLCVGVLQCMDISDDHLAGVARIIRRGGWFLFETLNAECVSIQDDLAKGDCKRLINFLNDNQNNNSHIVFSDFSLYHADKLSNQFMRIGLRVKLVKWMFPADSLLPQKISRTNAQCFYLYGEKI